MGKLYDRADIYDLIESDARTEVIRKDWEEFLGDRTYDCVVSSGNSLAYVENTDILKIT